MNQKALQTDRQKPERVAQLTKKLNELVAREIAKSESAFVAAPEVVTIDG